MGAPNITFTASRLKLSGVSGFDSITVTFSADAPYQAFECRATKDGEDYGVGKGHLVASFSTTPAGTERTFEVYDEFLTRGDGQYRISLFAQGEDGSWNDNQQFTTSDGSPLVESGGKPFLSVR